MATSMPAKADSYRRDDEGDRTNVTSKGTQTFEAFKTGVVPTIAINTRPTGSTPSSSIGDTLLHEYAVYLEPLNTNRETHGIDGSEEPASTISQASTQVDSSPQDYATSLPSSSKFPSQVPASFLNHRKSAVSIDSIPRQTILKALASRRPNAGNSAMPLTASLSGRRSVSMSHDSTPGSASSRLSAALSELQTSCPQHELTPSTARFTSLKSPCFYHQRFDDAVNIEKVLEEIADDEWMSHSRLMQTATGVREVSKQLQRRPIKRAVRSIMIVTKARDNHLVTLTRELAEWLLKTPRYGSDLGINVYVDAKLRNSKRFDAAGLLDTNPRYQQKLKYWTPDLCWTSPEKFDLVLTLGGDGTVLFTSWLFQRIVPPILSFSLGSLGFLTNFEFAQYKQHLDRVLGEQGMRVNLRMRFTCTVYRTSRKSTGNGEVEEGEQFEVLNELVIDRGPSPYVSNLELYGDDELLTVVQADGCIFSTPTGKLLSNPRHRFSSLFDRPLNQTPSRLNGILPLRWRFPRAPFTPRNPPDSHLSTHPLLPPHGARRHAAPPHRRPALLPRNGILLLRRQRARRAAPGRLRDGRGQSVSVPDGCWRGRSRGRVVREFAGSPKMEHEGRGPKGVEWA